MPDIGPMELILLLAIVLLLFGPGKLPEVGKSLGNAIREFRKATTDVQDAARTTQPAAQAQAAPVAPATSPAVAQAAQVAPAAPAVQAQAAPIAPFASPAEQPAPAAPQPAPAPNTLSGSVEPNTIAEPGSEGTPRA